MQAAPETLPDYMPANLARLAASVLLGAAAFYLDSRGLIVCFVVHFSFAVLWMIAVRRGWIDESNRWLSGFLVMAVDITFVSLFLFFTGPAGLFAILLYMVITALASLSARFDHGRSAVVLSVVGFLLSAVATLHWRPWLSLYEHGPVAAWIYPVAGLLLFLGCLLVSRTIRALMLHNIALLEQETEARRQDNLRAEKRYRHLVEGSADLIFALDRDFRFLSLNRSFTHTLGHRPAEWLGRNFEEMLKPEAGSLSRLLIHEKLASLRAMSNPVSFSAQLLTRMGEAAEMNVRLEPVDFEEDHIIYGRATLRLDDSLIRYFHSERQRYTLTNYLFLADQVSERITSNASSYTDPDTLSWVRLGVRELLINAIEHGNLEIDYETKSKLLAAGEYLKFVNQRQQEAAYRERKVIVEHSINPDRAIYRIKDEGNGFDHAAMERRTLTDMQQGDLQHGRGMAMARSIFDVVRYNKAGNVVTVVKAFQDTPPPDFLAGA